AIFSLDKFAEGNHLSSSQMSAIKGGRKKIIIVNKDQFQDNPDGIVPTGPDDNSDTKDDNGGLTLTPPTPPIGG
ncbi:MAG TPA: hypothetical protein DCS93_24440, partial [Microscillaceae bacterium]|nr:hypothetical protein [Microscillaceae bacterium]